MAKIEEVLIPFNKGISDEIRFRAIFHLEGFDPVVSCTYLTKENKKPVHCTHLNIPEDIYSSWGADNQHIIDWASQQLNVTLIK